MATQSHGKLTHDRELAPIDSQTVPRSNRGTLCSTGVFDLDAGELCICLPEAGERDLSMTVSDEHDNPFAVVHGSCTHTFTRTMLGTRYAVVAIRIVVDPNDPKDLAEVHTLQDRIRLEQR